MLGPSLAVTARLVCKVSSFFQVDHWFVPRLDRADSLAEATETRIVGWCNAHDLVRAAILTNTRAVANAHGDRFSDLDVIVLRDIKPLSQHRGWLSDFGEVLAAWRDPDALNRDPPRTC